MATLLGSTTLIAYAATVVGNVYNNGQGWSTNYQEKFYEWHANGTTVSTGATGTARVALQTGQHYYAGASSNDITISNEYPYVYTCMSSLMPSLTTCLVLW